jgi:Terminase large subunit, T4likevirus-type, N-terminal
VIDTKNYAMQMAKALIGHIPADEIISAASKIETFLEDPALLDALKKNALIRAFQDSEVFASNVRVAHPIRGAIPLELYPFQRDLLKCLSANQFVVINGARQMGLTLCLATYMLHETIRQPYQSIVLGSFKFAHSVEILDRVRLAYNNLPEDMRPKLVRNVKSEMEFDNGSRILAASVNSDSFKGRTYTHLVLDNVAHLSHRVAEEFWISQLPIISYNRPKVVLASNATVQKGLFYDIWSAAPANGFTPFFMPWHLHPERDEAWAKSFRESLGTERWNQEFECQFEPV